ncbi:MULTISPECIES: hypothetical protein [unclassified Xanthomonas]|nr:MULTISPECIES: hypothetical protein [unclassified Xanthomonas]MBB5877244.1 hypothetical protein [Xanthomonas sp. 3498]MBB5940505.1 hypothetical protein [Xanthomonas sp. 3307]MXV05967.1 hypothetical protein [Xanthomonas sp. LMG 9002]
MNAQHPKAPVHECGLEAALQQMSKYLERARSRATERTTQATSPRPSHMRNVFASDAELSLVR